MAHERLVAAPRAQLARRPAGAQRVGWKRGGDIAEVEAVTGGRPAIGHLTSATLLADGDAYTGGGRALHADTELVVELGADGEIAAAGVALEIVDLARPPDDLEGIVAANVFHRAFALGPVIAWRGRSEASARSIRILTGAVTQVAARTGDMVVAEIDGLGRVALTIGP